MINDNRLIGLNVGQAVSIDSGHLLISLGRGVYRLGDDGVEFEVERYTGTTFTLESGTVLFRKSISAPTIHSYKTHNGDILTKEKVNEIRSKLFGSMLHEDDDGCMVSAYKDLEEEYACKKELLLMSSWEAIYTPEIITWEEVPYAIIGSLVDTGSRFIETAVSLGRVYENASGPFQVRASAIAMDEWLTLERVHGVSFGFELPKHSNLEFAKVCGDYIFSKNDGREIVTTGSVYLFATLDEAKRKEKQIREAVRYKVFAKINPCIIVGEDLSNVIKEIEKISASIKSLSVKTVSVGERSLLLASIGRYRDLLEGRLKAELNTTNKIT